MPLEEDVQGVADRAAGGVAGASGGGGDGRVHRVQGRHHRGATQGGGGDGPVPRHPPDRPGPAGVPPPVQQDCHGRRGPAGDPLFEGRRLLLTGATLHTEKQCRKVQEALGWDEYVPVAATWGVYQAMVDAYRHQNRRIGKFTMRKVIDSLTSGVPEGLVEVARLGRTPAKRAGDILAYFDHPGTSDGPTEAINGRLEHLRGSALRFRNLANYVARSLLEAGGFRVKLHAGLR